jgi:hypothetical protein
MRLWPAPAAPSPAAAPEQVVETRVSEGYEGCTESTPALAPTKQGGHAATRARPSRSRAPRFRILRALTRRQDRRRGSYGKKHGRRRTWAGERPPRGVASRSTTTLPARSRVTTTSVARGPSATATSDATSLLKRGMSSMSSSCIAKVSVSAARAVGAPRGESTCVCVHVRH